ncbi:phage holin [Bacillus sp. CGMCC 1.16541]|uniref:phage holin n=1 Tax=Bacillus sp. CGMCC 1.16541 TaxID=2185143 RepID=UPI000D72670B|nr:phage holin [Bacillus sp. CGMCC 1.16541]
MKKPVAEKKDYLILIGGFLASLKMLLASLGYDVIPNESIDAIVNLIGFGVALYAVWKNTYVSPKGLEQKKILKDNGLK